MSDCAQIRGLYEAYALGALDAQDRQLVEAHLASGCADCAIEIGRVRWVISQLAYLAPESDPPIELRKQLIKTVHRSKTEGQHPGVPAWGWVAAAAICLLTFYSAYHVDQSQKEIVRLQAELEQQRHQQSDLLAERQTSEQAFRILSALGTREISLKPQGPFLPVIRAFWNPKQGLLIAGSDIPALPEGQTFQLWLVPKSGDAISAGVFRPDRTGKLLAIPTIETNISSIAALAVSEEPTGGLPKPTKNKIRWSGAVL